MAYQHSQLSQRDDTIPVSPCSSTRSAPLDTSATRPLKGLSPDPEHGQTWDGYETVPIGHHIAGSDIQSEDTVVVRKSIDLSAGQSKLKDAKWWLAEILATLLSVGLLIAIYIILTSQNGKQTSSWPLPISLSALIATLSTISRVCLGMVASEVISQSKWSSLRAAEPSKGGIPLYDLELYDKASRGPWGTIGLFRRSIRKPDLLLTLVVALASNAMGPFAQQAVLNLECQYIDSSETAIIPNIQTLGDFGPRNNATEPLLGPAVKEALMSSLQRPNSNDSLIVPTCTTGNCTFPLLEGGDGDNITHQAVGFCSSCLDISSIMEHVLERDISPDPTAGTQIRVNNRWFLPGNHSLTHNINDSLSDSIRRMAFLNFTTTFELEPSPLLPEDADGWFNSSRYALVNMTFISLDDLAVQVPAQRLSDDPSVSATVCSLFPCLKSYFASIERGQLTERLVSNEILSPYGQMVEISDTTSTTLRFPSDMMSVRTPCHVDGQVYGSENISSAPNAVTLTRSDFGDNPIQDITDLPFDDPEFMVNITAPPQCLYAVDTGVWYDGARNVLQGALAGECSTDPPGSPGGNPCEKHSGGRPSRGFAMDYYWLEGFARLRERTVSELSTYMDSVAESLTSKLRMNVDGVPGRAMAGNEWRTKEEVVVGDAWQTTTCFAVDWRWLILSSALTVIALGVLAWVLVRGIMSDEMVWKSSGLPLIFYRDRITVVSDTREELKGLGAEEDEPLMSVNEMEAKTKRVNVIFRDGRRKAVQT